MHLERAHRRHHHRRGRAQPRFAAFDVEEFLGPEIGAEPGFGDDVIGELQRRSGGNERIAAMGDIGKRPAMDEDRVVLDGLHQIGRQRVLQQRRHRSRRLDLGRGHRLALARLADVNIAEPPLQILEAGRQAEGRHDLRGGGDVEPVLARKAVGHTAERGDGRAQGPVVHVHRPPPRDPARIDARFEPVIDVVVDHRGEQVVRRADGVNIAGEMEVDLLHRQGLGIAAAGGAALDAEARAHARLAQAHHRLLAEAVERIAEPDRRRRLAFAGRGRGDRGDEDQPGLRPIRQRAQIVERDLGLVFAVGLDRVGRDAELLRGDLADRAHCRLLGDRDVRFRVFVLVLAARHAASPSFNPAGS